MSDKFWAPTTVALCDVPLVPIKKEAGWAPENVRRLWNSAKSHSPAGNVTKIL